MKPAFLALLFFGIIAKLVVANTFQSVNITATVVPNNSTSVVINTSNPFFYSFLSNFGTRLDFSFPANFLTSTLLLKMNVQLLDPAAVLSSNPPPSGSVPISFFNISFESVNDSQIINFLDAPINLVFSYSDSSEISSGAPAFYRWSGSSWKYLENNFFDPLNRRVGGRSSVPGLFAIFGNVPGGSVFGTTGSIPSGSGGGGISGVVPSSHAAPARPVFAPIPSQHQTQPPFSLPAQLAATTQSLIKNIAKKIPPSSPPTVRTSQPRVAVPKPPSSVKPIPKQPARALKPPTTVKPINRVLRQAAPSKPAKTNRTKPLITNTKKNTLSFFGANVLNISVLMRDWLGSISELFKSYFD